MATIMKKQASNLTYLEQVRQHLARLPSIDPYTRTIIICGFPNVGKSSFINKVCHPNFNYSKLLFIVTGLINCFKKNSRSLELTLKYNPMLSQPNRSTQDTRTTNIFVGKLWTLLEFWTILWRKGMLLRCRQLLLLLICELQFSTFSISQNSADTLWMNR